MLDQNLEYLDLVPLDRIEQRPVQKLLSYVRLEISAELVDGASCQRGTGGRGFEPSANRAQNFARRTTLGVERRKVKTGRMLQAAIIRT